MIEQSSLVAGARIEWTSQAGGFIAHKRGKIIAFVPRNQTVPKSLLVGDHRVHGNDRSHIDRYLILLEEKKNIGGRVMGKGRKKNHYYLPVASVVRSGKLIDAAGPVTPENEEAVKQDVGEKLSKELGGEWDVGNIRP